MANMSSGGGLSNGKLEMANAEEGDVLAGKTFYAEKKDLREGSMANRGAWNVSVSHDASVTIPAGYHNGGGKVTGNSINAVLSDSYTFNGAAGSFSFKLTEQVDVGLVYVGLARDVTKMNLNSVSISSGQIQQIIRDVGINHDDTIRFSGGVWKIKGAPKGATITVSGDHFYLARVYVVSL